MRVESEHAWYLRVAYGASERPTCQLFTFGRSTKKARIPHIGLRWQTFFLTHLSYLVESKSTTHECRSFWCRLSNMYGDAHHERYGSGAPTDVGATNPYREYR